MSSNNRYKHLTLEERQIILTGIKNGSTKAAIAETLGKDKSTIGKEIKKHRHRTSECPLPLECAAYKKCTLGRNCTTSCSSYKPFTCRRRDHSPGVCTGCPKRTKCRFDKYDYSAVTAHSEYTETLSDSREGADLTYSRAEEIAGIVGPLLNQGQSPYSIIQAHPELGICEKTLYNYIENGVFHDIGGIIALDLRSQVSRKVPKAVYKKRQDRKYLQGRTYSDYEAYMEENPDESVTQMDTVYNDVSNGPYIQTFKIIPVGVLLGILHWRKDAQDMAEGVDMIEQALGPEIFRRHANVLLTDRGPEFTAAEAMETSADGTRRTRVFYCDAMQAGQKGSLEKKHSELRYILPKGTDLKGLGLTDQDALNLVLSHVNSAPVKSLGGKSPLEMAEFLYPDLYRKLEEFGIHKIDRDKVILKPYLLKDMGKK